MADLRSVTYGSTTFTIPSGGDYEARVAALETSVAALQAQLGAYEDVRLTLTGEGGTGTAYDVLGKEYVPPTPTPQNMFELAPGFYDAQGNFIEDLTDNAFSYESGDQIYYYSSNGAEYIPQNAVGIVCPQDASFVQLYMPANSPSFDWVVVPDYGDIAEGESYSQNFFGTSISDGVFGTIYYAGDSQYAPWGQTSATINTTGTPFPWA